MSRVPSMGRWDNPKIRFTGGDSKASLVPLPPTPLDLFKGKAIQYSWMGVALSGFLFFTFVIFSALGAVIWGLLMVPTVILVDRKSQEYIRAPYRYKPKQGGEGPSGVRQLLSKMSWTARDDDQDEEDEDEEEPSALGRLFVQMSWSHTEGTGAGDGKGGFRVLGERDVPQLGAGPKALGPGTGGEGQA